MNNLIKYMMKIITFVFILFSSINLFCGEQDSIKNKLYNIEIGQGISNFGLSNLFALNRISDNFILTLGTKRSYESSFFNENAMKRFTEFNLLVGYFDNRHTYSISYSIGISFFIYNLNYNKYPFVLPEFFYFLSSDVERDEYIIRGASFPFQIKYTPFYFEYVSIGFLLYGSVNQYISVGGISCVISLGKNYKN